MVGHGRLEQVVREALRRWTAREPLGELVAPGFEYHRLDPRIIEVVGEATTPLDEVAAALDAAGVQVTIDLDRLEWLPGDVLLVQGRLSRLEGEAGYASVAWGVITFAGERVASVREFADEATARAYAAGLA